MSGRLLYKLGRRSRGRRALPVQLKNLTLYLAANHECLVALLPPDVSCADLFGEVDAKRPIAGFFDGSTQRVMLLLVAPSFASLR